VPPNGLATVDVRTRAATMFNVPWALLYALGRGGFCVVGLVYTGLAPT
jgi:hypothetical protein